MGENLKKKFLLIFVIILIISIGLLILIKMYKGKKLNENILSNEVTNKSEDNFGKVISVKDKNKFFTVSECISRSINENLYFIPLQMNMLEGINIDAYSVYGFIVDKDYQNFKYVYYIVKLDSFNKTYSVEIKEGIYKSLDEVNLVNDDMEIKNNSNNEFSYLNIDDENIVRKYMDYYKKIILSNPDLMYNSFLDDEYKNKKFKNIEEFKKYINNRKEEIKNSSPVKYSIDNFTDYKKYTIQDNYNNIYILKENNIMRFKILLDNYTVNTEEFNEKYNKASDEVKISTNIDKIFKMINNKEYINIYENYLNINFKKNYFNEYQKFEEFINNKFFEYNYLGSSLINESNGYYIIKVNYKDGISSAAEARTINIIMKLNESSNFEFSFEM